MSLPRRNPHLHDVGKVNYSKNGRKNGTFCLHNYFLDSCASSVVLTGVYRYMPVQHRV